jgi:FkbM family methyltransferase
MKSIDYKFFLSEEDVILQVGSYDGIECELEYGLRDLMIKNHYNVHMIEPLTDKFESLKNNYSEANSAISFYNLAIFNKDGEEKFFLSETESSLIRHTDKEFVYVKTNTIQTFLQQNEISKVDCLFLDVEGVEHIIIFDLLNKSSIRPKLIRYEFPHLLNEDELIKMLEDNGYFVYNCCFAAGDRVCIRSENLCL